MAFVPNENGTEVTVLLLNSHPHHTSDGYGMPMHTPMIFARAGSCSGDCVDDDPAIANYVYRDQSASAALSSLGTAVSNGSAWILDGSDLSVQGSNLPALNIRDNVRGTDIIPTTSTELGDYTWIADLKELCGSGCTLNPDVFDNVPPAIVAARFTIDSGDLYTWSVARLGSDVTPVNFKRLDGTGSTDAYVQAVTSWVGLDIEVPGSSVQIVEAKHDSSTGRSMTLSPDANDLVEVAVVNLPPFTPPASSSNNAPQVGKHFELYYELLASPPARETRLVPRAGAPSGTSVPSVTWTSVHTTATSGLLNALRMEPTRSLYDRIICPPTDF